MSTTSYDLIFDRFLSKITDYELQELVEVDLRIQITKYLNSAISDFKYSAKNLSDRSDVNFEFNVDLNDIEQEILAKFMLVHWLNPHILRLENVRNELGNKEFRLYSPANFLDKISVLKKSLISEVNGDMVFYYYST
jgi:hypothetical protein